MKPERSKPIVPARCVCDNLCTMSNSKPTSPITDILKDAIVESGISYKALARDTGVARAEYSAIC